MYKKIKNKPLAVLPWAFGLQRYCKNLIKRRDWEFILFLSVRFLTENEDNTKKTLFLTIIRSFLLSLQKISCTKLSQKRKLRHRHNIKVSFTLLNII